MCGGLKTATTFKTGVPPPAIISPADGRGYLPLLVQPVLVFEAGAAKLQTLRERAERRDVPVAIYTMPMFGAGNDADNRAAVRRFTTAELDLAGLPYAHRTVTPTPCCAASTAIPKTSPNTLALRAICGAGSRGTFDSLAVFARSTLFSAYIGFRSIYARAPESMTRPIRRAYARAERSSLSRASVYATKAPAVSSRGTLAHRE